MRITLSLHGGIYGSVHLEPIETEDENVSVPDDLVTFVRSSGLKPYEETAAGGAASGQGDVRTEAETYRLTVSDAGGVPKRFAFSKSATEADSNLKRLVDLVWSTSRPVPGS